jgi:hypothetical protein
MDVSDEFLQVSVFLTQDGFVTVLKEVPVAVVLEVKRDRVSREEAAHQRGNGE